MQSEICLQKPHTAFYVAGITSTIWFLVRVIPKPTRATYPCMRAAAPLMSGFVIYLLGIWGSAFAFKAGQEKLCPEQKLPMDSFSSFYLSVFLVTTTTGDIKPSLASHGTDHGSALTAQTNPWALHRALFRAGLPGLSTGLPPILFASMDRATGTSGRTIMTSRWLTA